VGVRQVREGGGPYSKEKKWKKMLRKKETIKNLNYIAAEERPSGLERKSNTL